MYIEYVEKLINPRASTGDEITSINDVRNGILLFTPLHAAQGLGVSPSCECVLGSNQVFNHELSPVALDSEPLHARRRDPEL
jgi:hypothetical protein